MPRTHKWKELWPDGTGVKACPRCKKDRYWDPSAEARGGEWYGRRVARKIFVEGFDEPQDVSVFVPSPYCRKCTNELRTERNRTRRALDEIAETEPERAAELRAEMFGKCGVCSRTVHHRYRLLSPAPVIACEACRAAILACEGDVEAARDAWKVLWLHNAREQSEKVRYEVRQGDGKRYRWHLMLGPEELGFSTHPQCLHAEQTWYAVFTWLRT